MVTGVIRREAEVDILRAINALRSAVSISGPYLRRNARLKSPWRCINHRLAKWLWGMYRSCIKFRRQQQEAGMSGP